uniref:Peptidase S1 domain-containing protein n=1 Tax=Phytophthora ramorum TaxID=164328 RepID=H3H6S1_PHYRM
MKLLSVILSVASVALAVGSLVTNAEDGSNSYNVSVADLVPGNISSDDIGTSLTTKNSTVPIGTKTYVVSLRVNATHNNSCAGTLITPKHVLTGGASVGADIRYASIGSHYNNGAENGEQIKVVAIMSHPNNSENSQYSYDFVVLELERPSSFAPIKLAAADGSDIKDGEIVTKLGWYNTAGEGQRAHELQRADVRLISNEECSRQTFVDETMMCSAPVGNQSSCTGDYGGPLILERPDGDILVGSVSWGDYDVARFRCRG